MFQKSYFFVESAGKPPVDIH